MLKKSLLYFSVLMLLSMQNTFASDSAQLHFSTIGGPSMMGQMSSDMIDANLINDASVKYSGNEKRNAKSYKKNYQDYDNANMSDNDYNLIDNTRYNFKKGFVNTSNEGRNYEDMPYSGVNSSKTMYTDELGRLHFFGKGNIIRK